MQLAPKKQLSGEQTKDPRCPLFHRIKWGASHRAFSARGGLQAGSSLAVLFFTVKGKVRFRSFGLAATFSSLKCHQCPPSDLHTHLMVWPQDRRPGSSDTSALWTLPPFAHAVSSARIPATPPPLLSGSGWVILSGASAVLSSPPPPHPIIHARVWGGTMDLSLPGSHGVVLSFLCEERQAL